MYSRNINKRKNNNRSETRQRCMYKVLGVCVDKKRRLGQRTGCQQQESLIDFVMFLVTLFRTDSRRGFCVCFL